MEWLVNNSTAVITATAALLAAAIAGSFALLGALVNIRANKQQRDDLFQAEKWKSHRQLSIEKGEEALGLISVLCNEFLAVVNATTIDTVSGKEGTLPDSVKDRLVNTKSGDVLLRLDTLIIAYFPDFLHLKDEIVLIFNTGLRSYFEYWMGNINKSEAALELVKCNEELTAKSKFLKMELSKRIAEAL